MQYSRTTRVLALLSAGLTSVIVPLLPAATGPAHGNDPMPSDVCAGVEVPAGHTCEPAPKQCFTTPCPQYALVPPGTALPGPAGRFGVDPPRSQAMTVVATTAAAPARPAARPVR